METQFLPPKKGQSPPIFGPCLLWPNGWMDQDTTCYRGRPRPRPHCVRWEPSSPHLKKGTAPTLWTMFIVVKWLDGSRCHLVQRYASARPGHIVLHRDPAPPKRATAPQFLARLLWPNGRPSQIQLSTC